MANVYGPNQDQGSFLSVVLNKLLSFGGPCFILGGDLNVTLSPAVDTSSGKSSISHTALTLSGIVPGHEARDNTTKTIHLISYIQRHNLKAWLLSFDAEKAFDRVNWQFLRLSLEQIGLGPTFVSKVMALYSCPSATVLVNGSSYAPFKISNGTRLGCPLSPLIFCISNRAPSPDHQTKHIYSRDQTPSSDHKLSLYTDDLLVYIQKPHMSLPSLMQEFRRFGEFSNFKLNMSKRATLYTSLQHTTLT